ncbi:diguanylate cyclase [Parazoarcus communis]|uniref:diguanylate cyclase n=1 Tax=Parazoarcus communis TaxID=41977 RepID=UPI001F2EC244|nr:diguanylate cyclase [Parazoarcus communis]
MASTPCDGFTKNSILAAIPDDERRRLLPDIDCVHLELGQTLYEPGGANEYVYFPKTCVASLVFSAGDGTSAGLATVGNTGLVGLPLLLSGESSVHHAVVHLPGDACRVSAEILRWEFSQDQSLQRIIMRYAQALMCQLAQSAVCNRLHTVDQQLCRWLLLSLDRVEGNELHITQGLIANMLGVRREGISEAASKLQAKGLIHYRRGNITVLDRTGIEARACECYAVVKAEYDRMLNALPHHRPSRSVRPNPANLRRRAEDRRQSREFSLPKLEATDDRLIHELQVRQIELEMQREELELAYSQANELNKRYADLYDFAPVGYVTIDGAGTIIEINLSAAILLGLKRSEASQHRFAEVVAPEQRLKFNHFVEQVRTSQMQNSCELPLIPTDRRPKAFIRIQAVTDDDGHECRMVILDITAERLAEEKVRERDYYQRALLDNFPFMVWLKDEQSRFLAVNTPFAKNYGWGCAADLVGKTDFDTTTPSLAESYRADDQDVLRSGSPKNIEEQIESNGIFRWYETYKSPVSIDKRRIGTVGFARDVTERKGAQEALAESELRYRSLIEHLPISLIITQNKIIRHINPRAARLLGYTTNECTEKSILDFVFRDDHHGIETVHVLYLDASSSPQEHDARIISRDGRVIECHWHMSSVMWEGKPAALNVLEDVTEHRRVEAKLRMLASTDTLTGLGSRRHFIDRAEEALSQLHRDPSRPVSLMVLDLDRFKTINDKLGHAAGDSVLRLFADSLRQELRKSDTAGRLGGDEFAVLLPGTSLATAGLFAERLRSRFASESAVIESKKIFATVSIGIAAMAASDTSVHAPLARADRALYLAKTHNRNRVEFAPDSNVDVNSRS